MRILKSIAVAFSIYSKIPMPRFNWKKNEMEFHLCFFPLVGAVIGLVEFGWIELMRQYAGKIGLLAFCLIAIAIPLIITGGFHLDGFMDTSDAKSSYQSRERRLEILKDPHIGAFSVIKLVVYLLFAISFISMMSSYYALYVACFSFALARTFSGLSVISFKSARSDGMLSTFASSANEKIVRGSLIIWMLIIVVLSSLISIRYAIIMYVAQLIAYLYYYIMSKKIFGGITGDLAGYFVCIAELVSLACISIYSFI